MQGCLELPSLVDLTIYLFDLNEEVSLSLGIMAQRQMLTNVVLLCIFMHAMYKEINIVIIYINVRKKEKLHQLLFITKR